MRGQRRRRGRPQTGPQRQRRGDYRIFVGAFPEGELIAELQALRERIDPVTAAITPPHVTLAGTYWRSGAATAENETVLIHRLQQHQKQMAPFTLELGGIRRFGDRVLYLGVRPTRSLLAVRQALLKVTGADKHRRFTPHLTLAQRLTPTGLAAVEAELVLTKWEHERWRLPVTELHLMQRGPDDPAWRSIANLELKG
jgi:2'-5' RNA ligase